MICRLKKLYEWWSNAWHYTASVGILFAPTRITCPINAPDLIQYFKLRRSRITVLAAFLKKLSCNSRRLCTTTDVRSIRNDYKLSVWKTQMPVNYSKTTVIPPKLFVGTTTTASKCSNTVFNARNLTGTVYRTAITARLWKIPHLRS